MSLLSAKMKKTESKMKALDFSRRSRAACSVDSIWPKFRLIQDITAVLVTCKNEEDPIKNKGALVTTQLYVDFSDVQGQIIRTHSRIYGFMHAHDTCKNEEHRVKNEGS